MVHLIIGAGGMLLLLAGLFVLIAWATGGDTRAALTILLGSLVSTAIIVFFVVQLSIGLEEVFFSTNE